MKLYWAIFSLLLFNAASVTAKQSVTPNDLFSLNTISSHQISSDGSIAFYLTSKYNSDTHKFDKFLYLHDRQTGKTVALIQGDRKISSPKWSSDHQSVYFLSKTETSNKEKTSTTQVYRISLDGSDSEMVTQSKQDIRRFTVGAAGDYLYYITQSTIQDSDSWSKLRKQHDSVSYGHGTRQVHQIHQYDLKTGKTKTLVDNKDVIWDFAVSPDNSMIAMVTTPDNEIIHYEGWSDIKIFDRSTNRITTVPDKQFREKAPSPNGYLSGLAWSPDSQKLAFGIEFDGYPAQIFFSSFKKGKSDKLVQARLPEHISVSASQFQWRGDTNEFCFLGDETARRRLYCASDMHKKAMQAPQVLVPDSNYIRSYSFSQSGNTLSYVQYAINYYGDLFIQDTNKNASSVKRLTRVNPQMDSWPLPNIEIVKWKSKDGTQIEGVLETPQNYKKSDGPLPLVVSLHGGPGLSDKLTFTGGSVFSGGRTVFSTRGWAVLAVNYRGSTGYGKKFMNDLIGRENDIEVDDILTGVDHLVKTGIADESKMAIMGWSNGGSLTSWIITQTQRFKAASVGAGVFDKTMQWIIEDTPGHVYNYIEGYPWEKFKELHVSSPVSAITNVKTPTLIHVGGEDERVPPAHAKGLYRVLKQYLSVPVELLIYPGEAHGVAEIKHKQAKLEWEIRWFDHYVLGRPIP